MLLEVRELRTVSGIGEQSIRNWNKHAFYYWRVNPRHTDMWSGAVWKQKVSTRVILANAQPP